jgi:valyl-tRNA synthetase
MNLEIATRYDPAKSEPAIGEKWLRNKAAATSPDERAERYVIMMPLPNVTGALHMGHAMDNVMQDLLIRWHRMMGENTLWMAGTDHAGIATQAVVEKRLKELEGKTRRDVGREELVRRIWAWKDQYEERIVRQLKAMGCSCDWDRRRFTMDAICARAVRHTFFAMFKDGLIYRGDRLVNWDCSLRTAVADDELYKATVQGHFYYLRYPVIDPQPGEPKHLVVATTRPETMLADTAVACHPDPERALERAIEDARTKLSTAPAREQAAAESELDRLIARRESHLPRLLIVAAMARAGRKVMLPLQERPLPLITDEWAKPELGTGCVKITPGHDPNDYDVWRRHRDEIEIVNILNPDGSLNENAGSYRGQDRFEARDNVVADLEAGGLLEKIEDREIEIDHSDRSKSIIEPYLSKQWFVRMADVEGGVVLGRGTDREFTAAGLAQLAIDAARGTWKSATGRSVAFHPDPDRYRKIYENWLVEKRDWCISRQLWWGHRIPVWRGDLSRAQILDMEGLLGLALSAADVAAWAVTPGGRRLSVAELLPALREDPAIEQVEVQVCFLDEGQDQRLGAMLRGAGLELDPDVLDTWFSSALWPQSTLGWPDPDTAALNEGQSPLKSVDGHEDCLSYYYPGSCLVTGRDIITLWVARMVIMGLYNLGDVPFTDVFIHAIIMDGKGERMSKSKGNGIDPVDIIERYGADALRYVMCEMQTGTQDVRLPVQAISPFTGKAVDLATAKHGQTIFTYVCPETGKEFDVLGTMEGVPDAKLVSDRFDVGRNFCNKLWNAARFSFLNLDEVGFRPLQVSELSLEDRWILSRLAGAIDRVHRALVAYNPSAALSAAREFFWGDLCDWYLEAIKPRLRDAAEAPVARQVLATALDQVLRLLHPFVPFITEALWEKLNERAPIRGIEDELPGSELLVQALWPGHHHGWQDEELEGQIGLMQEVVTGIRETRARYNVSPSTRVSAAIRATGATAAALSAAVPLIAQLSGAEQVEVSADARRTSDSATAVVRDAEIYVLGVVDAEQERAKFEKQRDKLQQQIAGKQKKLGNQAFISKAPPEVVERERGSLEGLKSQLKRVEDGLADLQ